MPIFSICYCNRGHEKLRHVFVSETADVIHYVCTFIVSSMAGLQRTPCNSGTTLLLIFRHFIEIYEGECGGVWLCRFGLCACEQKAKTSNPMVSKVLSLLVPWARSWMPDPASSIVHYSRRKCLLRYILLLQIMSKHWRSCRLDNKLDVHPVLVLKAHTNLLNKQEMDKTIETPSNIVASDDIQDNFLSNVTQALFQWYWGISFFLKNFVSEQLFTIIQTQMSCALLIKMATAYQLCWKSLLYL